MAGRTPLLLASNTFFELGWRGGFTRQQSGEALCIYGIWYEERVCRFRERKGGCGGPTLGCISLSGYRKCMMPRGLLNRYGSTGTGQVCTEPPITFDFFRGIKTIYWPDVKWRFIHRGDLEMVYFASDEGASKIIVRESPRCIKSHFTPGQYLILFFFDNIFFFSGQ